ncbi:MAG: hypothetical protein F6Q13_13450 [Mycobacterium sp.]|nr:MAG: hypothetical protein F6Q13_13450 [Mycobacterium sp.]
MDTVLGLALTSTAAGWVLVEGHDAEGAIVDCGDLPLRTGGGARAVRTAERVVDAVLSLRADAARLGQRVRAIGVIWSDDVPAEAALLLEWLADAEVDNVVPVHAERAAELSASASTPSRSPLALARGAARASVRHPGFTDPQFAEAIDSVAGGSAPACARRYAGAMTMLAVGAVAFVTSVSLIVGYRLLPDRPPAPVEQVGHRRAAPPGVPPVVAPATPPPAVAAPPPQSAPEPSPPAEPVPVEQLRSAADEPPVDPPAVDPELPPPPDAAAPEANPHPLLTRLLERLHGEQPDPEGPVPPGASAP